MERNQQTKPSTLAHADAALYRQVLNQKLRLAFIAGAEERARHTMGRPLSADELRRVLCRYPGDLPER
jgi:hypothetical protein